MKDEVKTTGEPAQAVSNPDSLLSRFVKSVLLTPVRLLVHFVALLVFFLVAITLTQQCEIVFEKIELKLPTETVRILAISNWLTKFWYLLFVALIFVDAPLLFCLQMSPVRLRWLTNVWFVGILLLVLLAVGWTAVGLWVPLRVIAEFDIKVSRPSTTSP